MSKPRYQSKTTPLSANDRSLIIRALNYFSNSYACTLDGPECTRLIGILSDADIDAHKMVETKR